MLTVAVVATLHWVDALMGPFLRSTNPFLLWWLWVVVPSVQVGSAVLTVLGQWSMVHVWPLVVRVAKAGVVGVVGLGSAKPGLDPGSQGVRGEDGSGPLPAPWHHLRQGTARGPSPSVATLAWDAPEVVGLWVAWVGEALGDLWAACARVVSRGWGLSAAQLGLPPGLVREVAVALVAGSVCVGVVWLARAPPDALTLPLPPARSRCRCRCRRGGGMISRKAVAGVSVVGLSLRRAAGRARRRLEVARAAAVAMVASLGPVTAVLSRSPLRGTAPWGRPAGFENPGPGPGLASGPGREGTTTHVGTGLPQQHSAHSTHARVHCILNTGMWLRPSSLPLPWSPPLRYPRTCNRATCVLPPPPTPMQQERRPAVASLVCWL
jgi:hypothetical protein